MAAEKRVCLISVHCDPAVDIGGEEAGGQNVYVREVGERLARQGWHVDMFTRKTDAARDAIHAHSRNCRTIRISAGPEEFVPRQEILGFRDEFVSGVEEYYDAIGERPAIIHTNYWISGAIGLRLQAEWDSRLFHTYHSLGAVKYEAVDEISPIARTRLEIENDCLDRADAIVATSPVEKDQLDAHLTGEGNVTIVPCGTDTEQFSPMDRQQARRKLDLPIADDIVFYLGRFDERKGIETLVRAVGNRLERSENRDLSLVIGGGWTPGKPDERERKRIGGIVDELGISFRTTFTGRISADDLRQYYSAADVCVVPSHYEPFGLVAIESMACETPVVASDVGGLGYTVQHRETGLLVPPEDVDELARAIDELLENDDLRAALGKRGRERVVSQFSWESVATDLIRLYETHLSNTVSGVEE